ncbi:DUF4124 domain-containing protein [Pseudoalteromonas sp. T1lg65]|uniref:DUF4124 domain-containing protein n=1 Tax=Pseudoalteromonas sp. T1lg65 TaxID=2077101 RepID=UPI003F79F2C4
MSRSFCCLLLALLSFSAICEANQTIYRWKNEKGHWVYSDVPKKGAEVVNLTTNRAVIPSTDTSILDAKPKPQNTIAYSAKITSPEHQQTIRDNSGSLYVSGTVLPRFSQGLSVQLYLNGEATGPQQTSTQFALRNLDRGEHQLILKVFNNQGKMVAQSEPHTFYLHRNAVGN